MRNKTFETMNQEFNILILTENDSQVTESLREMMSNKFMKLGYHVDSIRLNISHMNDDYLNFIKLCSNRVIDLIYVINNNFSDGRISIPTASLLKNSRMLNIPVFFYQYVGDVLKDAIVPPMYLGPGDPTFYDCKFIDLVGGLLNEKEDKDNESE